MKRLLDENLAHSMFFIYFGEANKTQYQRLGDFIDASIKSAVREALGRARPDPLQMEGQSGQYMKGHSDCFLASMHKIEEILKEYE